MSEKKGDIAAIRALATWAGVTVGLVAFFCVLAAGAETVYARLNDGRMFPGVRILNVRLDGMTQLEARGAVQKAIDTSLATGLRFQFRGQEVTLDAATQATDPDASHELIHYDITKALAQAFEIGRNDGWRTDVFEQLGARIRPTDIPPEVTIDEKAIGDALALAFKEKLVPYKDASFTLFAATGTQPLVHVIPEQAGIDMDLAAGLVTFHRQALGLNFAPIPLAERAVTPRVRSADLESLANDAIAFIERPLLNFTYENQRYVIPTSTVTGWVTVVKDGTSLQLAIDPGRFAESLRTMAPQLETPTKNGSLVIKDGKITSFVAGTLGYSIDTDSMYKQVNAEWPATSTFALAVKVTSGSLLGEDPQRLGIKEMIGVGHSNFSGSPSNRRKNIAHGAAKVSGTIIAPGEEFSMLKTLGPVDGPNGWLTELVIKGNKTTPEFGGGLCQIGTTTFRAALDSGLKITERQNHSYRVRYYEPAGTDATIYDPKPDFRFVNDTAHSILINAYIKGDDVTFEFWGTKDDRKVDPIQSHVYNIVPPPPMKLVETLDLAPGKKKCTETAHAGADADFNYNITYADGTKHHEVFTSHYRPWQAVCLIGVTQLTQPVDTSVNEPAVN